MVRCGVIEGRGKRDMGRDAFGGVGRGVLKGKGDKEECRRGESGERMRTWNERWKGREREEE